MKIFAAPVYKFSFVMLILKTFLVLDTAFRK